MAEKARYWTAVCYPENLLEDWQEQIADILQFPFAYCIHNADSTSKNNEQRKAHVHIVLCFNNTTTYKNAFSIFSGLNKVGCSAFNKIEKVHNIRYIYDYLIHDTDSCRKANKHKYDISERICGNNFDIGSFEQISTSDKIAMTKELCDYIVQKNISNFADFYMFVASDLEPSYFEILMTHSGLFERMTKAVHFKNL